MVGGAVANCAGPSFAGPKRATDRIPLLRPVPPSPRLPRASSCAVTVTSTSIRRSSIERRQTRLPRRACRARPGDPWRRCPPRGPLDPAALATAVEAWSAVYGSAAVRGEIGRARDATTEARSMDVRVNGRAIGAHAGGRRYRRHELALPDGGRLRLGVDGNRARRCGRIDHAFLAGGRHRTGPTRRSGSGSPSATTAHAATACKLPGRGRRERRHAAAGDPPSARKRILRAWRDRTAGAISMLPRPARSPSCSPTSRARRAWWRRLAPATPPSWSATRRCCARPFEAGRRCRGRDRGRLVLRRLPQCARRRAVLPRPPSAAWLPSRGRPTRELFACGWACIRARASLGGDNYVGLDVHRAARIGRGRHGGQVLISDTTRGLSEASLPPASACATSGEHRLKDLDQPERLVQLVGLGLDAGVPAAAHARDPDEPAGPGDRASSAASRRSHDVVDLLGTRAC